MDQLVCTDGLLLCLNDVLLFGGTLRRWACIFPPQVGRVKITYRFSMLLLCAVVLSLPCLAQVSPTFRFQQSNSTATPEHIFAMDFNNDGIPDIIETGDAGFAISISKGDGTFYLPVRYSFPTDVSMRVAAGDFNGDGNVDLMFASPRTTQLLFFAGNGKGAFHLVQTDEVQLAPTEVFNDFPLRAADFNHDGKLDLLVGAAGPPFGPVYPCYCIGPQDLYVLEGDGAGGFSAARSIYTVPEKSQIDSYAVGDFDGDNNADVVLTTIPVHNPFADDGTSDVSVFFGSGTSDFEVHLLVSTEALTTAPTLGTGDIDSDGHSDIYFIEGGTDQLWVYLGHPDRSFTLATSDTPSLDELQYDALVPGEFAMADLNGDGRMDLVAYAYNIINVNNITSNLLLMLGAGAPGKFKYQVMPLPQNYLQNSQTVVGNFNGDTRPDVVVGLNEFGKQSILLTAINTTTGGLWSNCGYPMRGQRIKLCSPIGFSDGKVSFNATASSFGQLRKMELWVDGTKIAEQRHAWENRAWLNFATSLAPGVHHAALFADDIDHSLNQINFSFTIGNDGCAPPSSPRVNICKPGDGSFPGSPTSVQATARITGTLARMEIWVDGLKEFTQTTSTLLNAAVGLKAGSHHFEVFAVNTAGNVWKSGVTATVK